MSKDLAQPGQIMLPVVVPLEQVALTDALSGVQGQNRGTGRAQIRAGDDREAVLAWLANYADSLATLSSYRKEVERLLLWAVLQHRRALSDLTHEDFLLYELFLTDPQPADRWVMASGIAKPARSSSDWRPFAGPLSDASQRQAMNIINGLFNWLVGAGYLAGNPLALRRRKRAAKPPRVTRFLPRQHWEAVKSAILAMPTDTARKADRSARARWLFTLLYVGGLRVTEVCDGVMGNFFLRRSSDGTERWWLETTGKGEKTRLVPATTELIEELKRYRMACDLKPLPSEGDTSPLVLPLIGGAKPLTRSAIHVIVKETLKNAANHVRAKGAEFEGAADLIESASTHWMRHTAGSHQTDAGDLKNVRDNLGHASIGTTSLYVHTEDDARHDATNKVHKVGW